MHDIILQRNPAFVDYLQLMDLFCFYLEPFEC